MSVTDAVWMAAILAGAGWLFYRSVVRNRGHCPGCDAGRCEKR